MLEKVKAPDATSRTAMYYPERQEEAYQRDAYAYLQSVAMVPRMAIIAAYVRAFGITRVLDIGCGPAELLVYLDPQVAYVGIDISPTAVEQARQRFGNRAKAEFHAANFRSWEPAESAFDGVVWAGIGCTWTRKGRSGNLNDWLDVLQISERFLKEDGKLVFEMVTPHWPSLAKLVEGRYEYLTGCDLDCFHSEESPRRSIRVFRKKA